MESNARSGSCRLQGQSLTTTLYKGKTTDHEHTVETWFGRSKWCQGIFCGLGGGNFRHVWRNTVQVSKSQSIYFVFGNCSCSIFLASKWGCLKQHQLFLVAAACGDSNCHAQNQIAILGPQSNSPASKHSLDSPGLPCFLVHLYHGI